MKAAISWVKGVASVPAPKTISVLLAVAGLGLALALELELELEPQAATPRTMSASARSTRAKGGHRRAVFVLSNECKSSSSFVGQPVWGSRRCGLWGCTLGSTAVQARAPAGATSYNGSSRLPGTTAGLPLRSSSRRRAVGRCPGHGAREPTIHERGVCHAPPQAGRGRDGAISFPHWETRRFRAVPYRPRLHRRSCP